MHYIAGRQRLPRYHLLPYSCPQPLCGPGPIRLWVFSARLRLRGTS